MKLIHLLKGAAVREAHADTEMEITGVSYDSRTTEKGDVFVAVRGYESDGHNYIKPAVLNGAACVLCEEKPDIDIPYVLLENTRRGLAAAERALAGMVYPDDVSRMALFLAAEDARLKTLPLELWMYYRRPQSPNR